MFRKLLLALAATVALALPAIAQDDPQLGRIAAMPAKELDTFLAGIATAVNQDSLKMRGFAQTNDCLDLTRSANSLALGHIYLAAVRDAAAKLGGEDGSLIVVKALQVRVINFAARVKAEEWLTQRCRNFTAPAEHAGDPRYATPPKVSNADYTDAVIEARQAAETNLAIAVNAGIAARCPGVITAGQNIALLMPYIEKLLADTAKRPEVLGPRASRRGLEVSRRQLAAALEKLRAEFGEKCKTPKAEPATPETDSKPAE